MYPGTTKSLLNFGSHLDLESGSGSRLRLCTPDLDWICLGRGMHSLSAHVAWVRTVNRTVIKLQCNSNNNSSSNNNNSNNAGLYSQHRCLLPVCYWNSGYMVWHGHRADTRDQRAYHHHHGGHQGNNIRVSAPIHGCSKGKCGLLPEHHDHRVKCWCSHLHLCLQTLCLKIIVIIMIKIIINHYQEHFLSMNDNKSTRCTHIDAHTAVLVVTR